eukprot:460644_1
MHRLATISIKNSVNCMMVRLNNGSFNRSRSASDIRRILSNTREVYGTCICGRELYNQWRYMLNDNGYLHGTKQCTDCNDGCMEFFKYQNTSKEIIGNCCNKKCTWHLKSRQLGDWD